LLNKASLVSQSRFCFYSHVDVLNNDGGLGGFAPKKKKGRKQYASIGVRVSPAEKATIKEMAGGHTMSSYLRKLGLGMRVESKVDERAIIALTKVNADQARLGNLINQWLAGKCDLKTQAELEQIRERIAALQKRMGEIADRI
jgi:hypothetical protein